MQWRRYEGAARPGCHHFGFTPFNNTQSNKTIKNNMFNIIENV